MSNHHDVNNLKKNNYHHKQLAKLKIIFYLDLDNSLHYRCIKFLNFDINHRHVVNMICLYLDLKILKFQFSF